MKTFTIVVITLAVFAILATGFLWVQNNALKLEIVELNAQVADANSELEQIMALAAGYLLAEGRAIIPDRGVSCEQEPKECLVYWKERLMETVGPDCDVISDNACPDWCTAGSDYDCCVAKPGYNWIEGRGCYSN